MFMVPRLREWRERRTLSTRELADKAGVGEATIWRLEAGKTARAATVRALAAALDVAPTDLQGAGREQQPGQHEATALVA